MHNRRFCRAVRISLADDDAFQLLQQLPRIIDNAYIFSAPRGGKLSDMALTAVIRRLHAAELELGRKGFLDPKQDRVVTTHGFRSTFRDWAADQT